MSINVKNREAGSLLEELKERTGKGASQIILDLLRAEADHQRRLADVERRRAVIEAAAARYSARLSEHPETPEAIIGYDENGLPT